jgi:hypothetical protein
VPSYYKESQKTKVDYWSEVLLVESQEKDPLAV